MTTNLGPNERVPVSGQYQCIFCGKDGIGTQLAEATGQKDKSTYLSNQRVVRYFEEGKTFAECPVCGKAAGWTLTKPGPMSTQDGVPLSSNTPISESGVCDICNSTVYYPDGYMLTTTQVVSAPNYWARYYQIHRKTFMMQAGITMYAQILGDPKIREMIAKPLAEQSSPWLICEKCIVLFPIDRDLPRDYAQQWWKSGRKFVLPGVGPAPLSAVNMGTSTIGTGKYVPD